MQEKHAIIEMLTDKKDLIESLVHRWGGSISEAAYDLPCQYFQIPDIEGFIGYRPISGCAIVYGDPVCPSKDQHQLASAFHQHCIQNKLNPIYISASEGFSKWAVDNICKVMIEVGEEMNFDPNEDPKEGPTGVRLRNRTNHARNLGLSVQEYTEEDESIEAAILRVGDEWLKGRRGLQIHLGDLNFFNSRNEKRWFYVKDKKDQIIGVALLSRLEAYKGWLLKFLMIVPSAPRGTSELLMINILQKLKEEGCHFLTYGMVPREELGEIRGLNRFQAWLYRSVFQIAKWIFHLEQRKLYWQKFHPKIEPRYILFGDSRIGLRELKALLGALKIS